MSPLIYHIYLVSFLVYSHFSEMANVEKGNGFRKPSRFCIIHTDSKRPGVQLIDGGVVLYWKNSGHSDLFSIPEHFTKNTPTLSKPSILLFPKTQFLRGWLSYSECQGVLLHPQIHLTVLVKAALQREITQVHGYHLVLQIKPFLIIYSCRL